MSSTRFGWQLNAHSNCAAINGRCLWEINQSEVFCRLFASACGRLSDDYFIKMCMEQSIVNIIIGIKFKSQIVIIKRKWMAFYIEWWMRLIPSIKPVLLILDVKNTEKLQPKKMSHTHLLGKVKSTSNVRSACNFFHVMAKWMDGRGCEFILSYNLFGYCHQYDGYYCHRSNTTESNQTYYKRRTMKPNKHVPKHSDEKHNTYIHKETKKRRVEMTLDSQQQWATEKKLPTTELNKCVHILKRYRLYIFDLDG